MNEKMAILAVLVLASLWILGAFVERRLNGISKTLVEIRDLLAAKK